MGRNERARIAEDTLRIIDAGEYLAPAGDRVLLRDLITQAKIATRLYDTSVADLHLARRAAPTRVTVTGETTCEAIIRLGQVDAAHLCALNFASAKNPGGGFLGGAQAQEEAVVRSSALYPCLLAQRTYYERNRANRSALYLDQAIFSRDVPFFRKDNGELLPQPVCASIITAPAPNAGAVSQIEPSDMPLIEPTLRRRAEFVLSIAAAEKVDRLILGAWGCGVFRNNPAMVADAFANLLLGEGKFRDVFAEVVFAIFDRTAEGAVITPFRDRFK